MANLHSLHSMLPRHCPKTRLPERRPARKLVFIAATLLLVLLATGGVSADKREANGPFHTGSSDWEGLGEFVRLAQRQLGSARVKVVGTLDYDSLKPSDAVVIVYPLNELDHEPLMAFLADGGRVAIFDDFGKGGSLLEKFNLRKVPPPLSPKERLRDDPDLAIAVPTTQIVAGREQGRHPIVHDVERVVTNHPRALLHPNLTPILEIEAEDGTAGVIAVTGIIMKKGRLLVVSDPSIFMNLMLRYPGNRQLTRGIFDYVVERSDEGKSERVGRVMIVSGAFAQHGRYGDAPGFWEDMKRGAASLIKSLHQSKDNGLPAAVILFLAGIVAIFSLARQLKESWPSPALWLPSFAQEAALIAQLGPAARGELLAARGSTPLLAAIELDSALKENLSARLGIDSALRAEDLQLRLVEKEYGEVESKELLGLLQTLRKLGTSLTEGRPGRTSKAQLSELHRLGTRHLQRIGEISRQR